MSIDINRLSLRDVQAEDESLLYRLFSLVKVEELGAEHWDEAQREQILRMQFKAHQQHYSALQQAVDDCIVEYEGQAVGRLIVQRSHSAIHLADIVLLPEFRDRGIGSGLLSELQAESRQSNRPIRLNVFRNNRVADLYRRLGFDVVTSTDAQVLMEWNAPV